MGKKRKRGASSSQDVLSQLPPVQIRYEDMPSSHKKKFFIHDDCGGLKKYIEVICWLRSMGCFSGSVFDDIPNLNWVPDKEYPLLEVEVITPENRSAKFIIYKNTLYLIGFHASGRWFQFKECGFIISGFIWLDGYDGKYKTKPWLTVGPHAMIDAVNTLALGHLDTASYLSEFEKAWEVFFFHLSEAGRYYAVESYVSKTLVPPQDGHWVNRTYENEEADILVMEKGKGKGEGEGEGEGTATISYEDDIYRHVEASGSVDFGVSRESPYYFEDLVKQYRNLSRVWYVKALTGGRLFPISDELILKCHMRSKKSLRCTLGALCNTNLDKVVDEWRRKPDRLAPEVFKEMETRICELQEKGQVRNSRQRVP